VSVLNENENINESWIEHNDDDIQLDPRNDHHMHKRMDDDSNMLYEGRCKASSSEFNFQTNVNNLSLNVKSLNETLQIELPKIFENWRTAILAEIRAEIRSTFTNIGFPGFDESACK